MTRWNLLGTVATAIILAACGGGGGGSAGSSSSAITSSPPPPPPAPVTQSVISEGANDFRRDFMTRAEFSPDGAIITGFKDVSDSDAFILRVPQRQTVRVTITGETLEFPALQLLDENEAPILLDQAITTNDYQDLDNVAEVTALLDAGRYLVRLTSPLVFVDGSLDLNAGRDFSGTYEVKAETVSLGGPDPDDLTVTGTVSKGLLSNAPVTLYAVQLGPNDKVVTLGQTVTDDNGRYEVTISREDAGSAFYVASTLSGATTICDAPLGCVTANLGEEFTYADDGFIPVESTGSGFIASITNTSALNTLRNGNVLVASVSTPTTAASIEQNVNLITTLMFTNIDIEQGGFASSFAVISVAILQATSQVSNLFGISGTDRFDIPFIDISQPITSTDEEAIKTAILAGGLQSIMSKGIPDLVYSAFIRDLLLNDGELIVRESTPNSTTVSLEDLYVASLEIEGVNQSTSEAYLAAIQSLKDDLVVIQAGAADQRTVEGEIQ